MGTPHTRMPPWRPWRGVLAMQGFRLVGDNSNQDLAVTAVETDGDCRSEIWPADFIVQPAQRVSILNLAYEWVRVHEPPLCTFVPERLRDAQRDARNQELYKALARILVENQTVAITSWGIADRLPGAGIMVYPAPYSKVVLAGAIFLTSMFPDFVADHPSSSSMFAQIPTVPSPRPFHSTFSPTSQQQLISPHHPNPHHHNTHHFVPSRYGQHVHGDTTGNYPQEQFGYVLHTPSPAIQYNTAAPSSSDMQAWQFSRDENYLHSYSSSFSTTGAGHPFHQR